MEDNNTFGINLDGAAASAAPHETHEAIKLEDLLPPAGTVEVAEYLTDEEQRDVNSIEIGISRNIPIVILFGARASGKTMALVRLSRWLQNNGYSIEPVRDFRPSNSKHYEKMCDEFSQNIYRSTAQDSTSVLNFMLAEVSKDGKSICQILEAPGEHYFDEKKPNMDFPTYIKGLKNAKVNGKRVPKTWVFIVECKWKGFEGQSIRPQYAKQIVKMLRNVSADDRIILLCHKADIQSHYFVKDNPVESKFLDDIKSDYAPMFEKLNNNLFGKMFKSETFKYDFVVFSAGEFNKRSDGKQQYTESDDKYPARLWKAIHKSVFN
jgi:GTPase SAR1 family protein